MRRISIIFLLIFISLNLVIGQSSEIILRYIEKYAEIAQSEMKRSGVPASITLAQAILESAAGTSMLATEGHNHFGIKCHNSWQGKKIYKDDDEKNECFRKYKKDEDSFIDHSDFLMNTKRYQFLFDDKNSNYKSWAHGLKKAGYATNPHYAGKLIDLVERYDLQKYDGNSEKHVKHRKNELSPASRFESNYFQNNHVKFIIVANDQSLKEISSQNGKFEKELFRYNDLPAGYQPNTGDTIYIQPKRRNALRGMNMHVVRNGETLWSVSQSYAIQLKYLRKWNPSIENDGISPGDTIYLRRHSSPKNAPNLKKKDVKEPTEKNSDDSPEFQFVLPD